jgi:hypothetical protein
MTKGKPWSADDVKKLKDWYELGVTDYVVLSFNFEGRYSQNAIYQKLLDLGLLSKEEEGLGNFSSSSSFSCSPAALELPAELPSIEEMLKKLAGAINSLETSHDKSDILRLRGIILGTKVYQERFREFVHYREIEVELMSLREKYAALVKQLVK